jgi:hypothetical protein
MEPLCDTSCVSCRVPLAALCLSIFLLLCLCVCLSVHLCLSVCLSVLSVYLLLFSLCLSPTCNLLPFPSPAKPLVRACRRPQGRRFVTLFLFFYYLFFRSGEGRASLKILITHVFGLGIGTAEAIQLVWVRRGQAGGGEGVGARGGVEIIVHDMR